MSTRSAFLFDLDGTLISTKNLYLECYRQALAPRLKRALTDEELIALKPRSEVRMLRALAEDAHDTVMDAFYRAYESLHDTHFGGIYDGVEEMLEAIRSAGHLTGIITGKSRRSWEITCTRAQLGPMDVLVFDDDVAEPKPDPQGISLALDRLRCDPAHAIYIGDTLGDVRAARAAGVTAGAVLWCRPERDRESFRARAESEGAVVFEVPEDVVRYGFD